MRRLAGFTLRAAACVQEVGTAAAVPRQAAASCRVAARRARRKLRRRHTDGEYSRVGSPARSSSSATATMLVALPPRRASHCTMCARTDCTWKRGSPDPRLAPLSCRPLATAAAAPSLGIAGACACVFICVRVLRRSDRPMRCCSICVCLFVWVSALWLVRHVLAAGRRVSQLRM